MKPQSATPLWVLLPLGIMVFSATAMQWAAQQMTMPTPPRLADRTEKTLAHYVGLRHHLEAGRDTAALADLAAAPDGPIVIDRFGGAAVSEDDRTGTNLFLNIGRALTGRAETAILLGRETRARTWLWHTRVLVRRIEAGAGDNDQARDVARRIERMSEPAKVALRDVTTMRTAGIPASATLLPGV